MSPLELLILASALFVGSHFVMSHPLRAPMVRLLGENGFLLTYSLVSLASMGWMLVAFRAVPPETVFWLGFDAVSWAIASGLTLIAMVLLTGSYIGNPALPLPDAEQTALRPPQGVFRVTRHPMMWAFTLWALAHLIAAPTSRTLVVSSAIAVLALLGAYLQDRKKTVLMGDAWLTWSAHTTFWPRLTALPHAGLWPWLIGTLGWLALTYAHIPLASWEAGIWRWIV